MLATLMLTALATTSIAESAVNYTPEDVFGRMEENDQYAEDAVGQCVNVSHRLAEMIVYVDSLNADEAHNEALGEILADLTALREDEEIADEKSFAAGCVDILRALVALAEESDAEGAAASDLEGIIADYNAGLESAEIVETETVQALYASVKVTSLVALESCSSQDQFDQIQAGMGEFAADDEAAANVSEQMAVGAKWLRKMLGAFSKLHNPDCAGTIDRGMSLREEKIASDTESAVQATMQYLASSVYALGIFTGYYTLE